MGEKGSPLEREVFLVYHLETFIIPVLTNLPGNPKPHKKSGYLTIRQKADGKILLVAEIGNCPFSKAEKYLRLSLEKGERLFRHPKHLSSWQSRDPEKEKYGGAIVTNEFILSFSGFREYLDEAMVLVLAEFLRWISREQAEKIAAISNNPFYRELTRRT